MPIRLTQTPPRCRVFPCAGIEVGIGRGLGAARDAEQRAEGVERVETPIEAERELVEVGLEMLRAHAMVDAVEPGLQVGEDEVDHRHELFGNLGVAASRSSRWRPDRHRLKHFYQVIGAYCSFHRLLKWFSKSIALAFDSPSYWNIVRQIASRRGRNCA